MIIDKRKMENQSPKGIIEYKTKWDPIVRGYLLLNSDSTDLTNEQKQQSVQRLFTISNS